MKLKNWIISLAFVIGVIVLSHYPATRQKTSENFVKSRVVKIETYNQDFVGQGTGTMLGHNYILTNAHLFPSKELDAAEARINKKTGKHLTIDYNRKLRKHRHFPKKVNQVPLEKPKEYTNVQVAFRKYNDSSFTRAILVSSNTTNDFAILTFEGKDSLERLPITDDWHLGESIILLGNPGQADFVLGHSRIVAYSYIPSPLGKVRPMIVYECNEGAPGFSGSGIYNLDGEFLGIHELGQTSGFIDEILSNLHLINLAPRLCFAIPSKEIMDRNLDRPWLGFNIN